MQKVTIKFKKVVASKTDNRSKALDLTVFYDENGMEAQMKISSPFDEPSDESAARLVREVKKQASEKFRSIGEDDFLPGYVNIRIDEKEDGITQEKIANTIRKFKEQVRNLRGMTFSKDYIQRFHQLSGGMEAEL